MGDNIPYFGDHVEESDGHNDFASTIGVGGVVGTQFVLPAEVKKHTNSDLTPQREEQMAKWVSIYKEKMLSRGEYLGELYDIGFDLPEAHAIRKGKEMYYAFYAKHWTGKVELRGLENRDYHVLDYETGKDLGKIHGPKAVIPADFTQHLLLEAQPQ
jgi:alpha-galactosidase